MFVEGALPSERQIVPYNYKPAPKLVISDLPEEVKDKNNKAKDVMTTKEEHTPRLVLETR